MSNKQLHITVAAAPNVEYGNPRLLEHDLRLTKASILYADRVKLCSMTAWFATSFHLMGNFPMSVTQQFEIMMSMAPAIASTNPDSINILELEKMHRLIKRNPITLTKKEKIKISKFKDTFPEAWEKMSIGLNEILKNFGFDEIEIAASEGLLEIHPFSKTGSEAAHEYISAVEEMLGSQLTHPMLDEQTSDLVRLALQEGKMTIKNPVTRKGKQVGLVSDLFDRLPIFDIRMDELLDIRDELQKPLINFRAEMVKLSKDIETAPWDEDFSSDVQGTYQSKVEPALQEIEEKLKSTTFREFWSKRVVDKSGFLATGAGFSTYLGAAVSPIVGIASALVGASLFTEAGFAELREKTSEIERNGLYFYYQIKKHTSSGNV